MRTDCYHHGYITIATRSDMRTEHQVSELLVTGSVQRFTDGLSGSSPEDFGQTLFRGHVIYSTFVDDDGGGGITVPGTSLGSQFDPDLTGFFLFFWGNKRRSGWWRFLFCAQKQTSQPNSSFSLCLNEVVKCWRDDVRGHKEALSWNNAVSYLDVGYPYDLSLFCFCTCKLNWLAHESAFQHNVLSPPIINN